MTDNRIRILAQLDDKVSAGLDKIKDKLDTIGGKGTGAVAFGTVAAKGLDVISGAAFRAGEAVGDFIGDSIKAASDLNESTSKSQVIFGGAAKAVADFAETADKSLGLSKAAALEAAASFGNLFLGTGQTQARAAELSKSLVTLAGDLASFNNLDPTETLQKLRSGLTGEAEPLRSVGVFLTEAKVKAKAMELGLADAHGELSEGAKVMARYQIILDETGTAQGDFARTSDGLANSTRSTNAELENLRANLGEKFLPIAKGATGAQLDLITGFGAFADMLSGKLTPEVLALNKAIGVSADAYNFTADELAAMTDETIDTAVALGILTQAEGDAQKSANNLGGKIDSLATRFPPAGKAADALGDDIKGVGTKATDAAVKVGSSMGSIVDSIISARSGVKSAASDLALAIYGPQIAAGELATTKREIAEQKQIVSAKNSTKAQVADAKQRIRELNATKIEQLATLAGYGDQSAAATLKHQLDVLESTRNLSVEQRAEIKVLRDALAKLKTSYNDAKVAAQRLADVRFDNALSPISGAPTARHSGGPVTAGEAYIVGEKRPELFVPSTSGYILPSVPRSGGGTTVIVNYNTGYSTASPSEAQAFAAAVVPAITREMLRQKVL